MNREISGGRKAAYYLGMGMMILGGLLFASTFVTFAMSFGDFTDFDQRARSEMLRAFGGMALLVVGRIVQGIGARGLASSGLVLDPQEARRELEPYSRMAGGVLGDALDEGGVRFGKGRVVMVKCLSCGKLNEEDSKFCQECGNRV